MQRRGRPCSRIRRGEQVHLTQVCRSGAARLARFSRSTAASATALTNRGAAASSRKRASEPTNLVPLAGVERDGAHPSGRTRLGLDKRLAPRDGVARDDTF
ncbi:MAG: hypothetical protein SFW67_24860 [Myxococcaceae bacterium]|nr:hypothetical protein [Myxococcaceae bacterium]